MSREDWDGIREHARRQHQERVAKTPQRLEYAIKQLKEHGITFTVCNDATGQINAYFTNGSCLTFYAGTGKIKGCSHSRGIKAFTKMCINENAKATRWDEACNLYIEYVQKFGRGPQANEKYKNVCLGLWVKQQRYNSETEREFLQYRYESFLSEYGYSKDPLIVYWEKMHSLCLKFIQKYNRLPKEKEQYRGKPLGDWLIYQNKLQKYNWLSEEHLNLLNQLQEKIIKWGKHEENWEKACLLYVEFVQKNGRGPTRNEMYKKINLGKWVESQRKRLKTEKEFLQQRYQAVLVKKGYSEDPLELYWTEMYRLCCEFVEINNRTPQNEEVYSDKPLGNWLAYQVKLMKYNCLTEDQYRLLGLLHIYETEQKASELHKEAES